MPIYLLKRTPPIAAAAAATAAAAPTSDRRQRGVVASVADIDEARREAIGRCRVRVQLLFNDIVVCYSDEASLSADFSAHIGQIFTLRVYEPPETITIVLSERFERGAWRELARIFVPVVGERADETPTVASAAAPLEPLQFASQIVVNS